MATPENTIAGVVGTAAGSALTAPLTGAASIISVIGEIAKPLIDLIPDPQKKLEAQQHVADQQFSLAMAQIDQQNKQMVAASANISTDTHMPGQRAYFCAAITSMLIFNYAGCPLLHAFLKVDIAPLNIPWNVLAIFAVIMLGFVGIPAALQMVQSIAGMPGDSQIKLPLGLGSVGNKS